MKRFIAIIVLLILPTLAIAEDRLPTPDCHRQPSDPTWLAQVVADSRTRSLRPRRASTRNGATAPARTRPTFPSPSGCRTPATRPSTRPWASTSTLPCGKGRLLLHQAQSPSASGGRHAAVLPNQCARRASNGGHAGGSWLYRAHARTTSVDPASASARAVAGLGVSCEAVDEPRCRLHVTDRTRCPNVSP